MADDILPLFGVLSPYIELTLIWAAQEGRVVVTHDRRTMPAHAADLIDAGENVAGLFVVPRSLPLRQAIEDLELLITCSENAEWVNVIRYLPL